MRRSPRLVGTVGLLILALVVCAVLAYQAWDAARSQRETADNTLRDYARIADWQLTQQAKNALLTQVVTALSSQASQVDPAHLDRTVLTPAQVEDVARVVVEWCHCLSGVRYFFRYDWRDGTLRTTETDLSDADLAWARDTVVAYTKSLPALKDRRVLAFGSPDGRFGPLKNLAVILTNDSYAMLLGERNKRAELLVFVVARDIERGEPVVVYGFATDPKPFLSPLLENIRGKGGSQSALLPQSLIGELSPDSILSISVTTLAGTEVYRSPGWAAPTYSAADTIEPSFGRLVMRVSLRPDFAGMLIVGGLPGSRIPALVALFVIAAGLLSVALLQLRRQQQLARLRTEFVSGVSHELRTPLAQIRWFAELLHLGKLRTEEERERSAGIIDQEARRLTYLVENVLNFSRSEKGTNRISPSPADLDHEIQDVIELFAPLARARKMILATNLDAHAVVTLDRDALRQILLNLLDNAAKYGPAGQTITVGSEISGGIARIWVEDQGPGIPHEDRRRVWDPYVRLNRSAESATGGSGIGLSVVRELVELHGGRTRAEGTPSGGARVLVELPLNQPEQPPRGGASDSAESNLQLKVVP
ncbi:MAG TPA: HAMP domain-containing sensor histidine kinase [Gemmatimonadaceae bacterium]|jgi:signal transduction histidine kinase|nr:HAMP domain-containing sensor histidine kinase [Gemmatimonadaceae bacterium]